MNPSNRIPDVSMTPTVARQTPRNDFSHVLKEASNFAMSAAYTVAELHPMGNVFSKVSSMLQGAGPSGTEVYRAPRVPPGQGGVHGSSPVNAGETSASSRVSGAPGGGGEGSSGRDLLEAQRALQLEGQQFQMQYLQLQNELQRESREYNTISNIMKVRHDSAKAAINNIR